MNTKVLLSFVLLLMLMPTGPIRAEKKSGDGLVSYESEKEYSGRYRAGKLYYRYSPERPFLRSAGPRELEDIHCPAAETALEVHGVWRGDLTPSGDCIAGDEGEWAIGNFLNYLDRRKENSR